MNVVLIEPEIHWNTGNIGRTCLAVGATLHLVEPLGFHLGAKEVRRAGLDYWPRVRIVLHDSIASFLESLPQDSSLLLFSPEAPRDFWDAPYAQESFLVFGKESTGLAPSLRRRFADRIYRIPVSEGVRSLNLSTAVGIVLYEAVRQLRSSHARLGQSQESTEK